jgi:uncharacterized protein (TIGR00255 family)
MRSMTGFGEAAAEDARLRVRARVRSVNHRFLDVQVRLPEEHWAHESELETVVRSKLQRGRVEVRLAVEVLGEEGLRLRVRGEALADLQRQLAELEAAGVLTSQPSPERLLALPGVIDVQGAATEWSASALGLLRQALDGALDHLIEERQREGARLAELLAERQTGLSELVGRIEVRWKELREGSVSGLAARISDLLGEAALPQERLVQEAALLADRADIGEELDRLGVHLHHLGELLTGQGSLGKRLDFLSQEVLRELNTTGSKCRDPQVVAWVVECKMLCEQLREQAQNVE